LVLAVNQNRLQLVARWLNSATYSCGGDPSPGRPHADPASRCPEVDHEKVICDHLIVICDVIAYPVVAEHTYALYGLYSGI
jgi:hypothetical protein